MTEKPRPPLSRRIQAFVMRIVNAPMRLILSLRMKTPLGKRLMLVYLTGRKSGKQYKQPISYVRDGDALLTPGGGKWKLNLVEGRPERVRLNGDEVFLRPELVRDPEEVDRLLGVMSSKNKMTERFTGLHKDAGGHYDRDRLDLMLKHGFCIVRWRPDESSAKVPAAGGG
jgi:hypothetical protein